ncbi:aminotransferase class IV [Pontibacter liquoris]|uniref:aminotransferase class IV n=1 Tax=Pontibacter liquoris TaxID=2905677 RepID=UPI001FA70D37|nr:aminotransferase class IV [Pontibacter liquoris]
MLLYNGHLMQEQALRLPLSNRAFQYNDGFFETLIVQQGRIRFWQHHVARMQDAAAALQIRLFDQLAPAALEQQLLTLAGQNKAEKYGRLKLKVWRDGAGLYTPQTDEAAWLATAEATTPADVSPLQVGLCRRTTTLPSSFSHFKGPNALVYVQAAREKAGTTYNDMLLLSPEGAVAELISSNIFWLQQNTLFTPSLTTGCVNGILRRAIMQWASEKRVDVVECQIGLAELSEEATVFAANVTGFRWVPAISGQAYGQQHPLLDQLQQDLFQ